MNKNGKLYVMYILPQFKRINKSNTGYNFLNYNKQLRLFSPSFRVVLRPPADIWQCLKTFLALSREGLLLAFPEY